MTTQTPHTEIESSSEELTLTSNQDPSNAPNSLEPPSKSPSSGRRSSPQSLPESNPLGEARTRLEQLAEKKLGSGKGTGRSKGARHYRRIKYVSGEAVNAEVAALRASGLNIDKIARALEINRQQVYNITKQPDFQQRVQKMRDAIKLVALSGIWSVHEKAWGLVEQSLDNGDAKAFDASTRGLGALEKIAASASGENKPAQINVQVANVDLARQEAQDLLRALLTENE